MKKTSLLNMINIYYGGLALMTFVFIAQKPLSDEWRINAIIQAILCLIGMMGSVIYGEEQEIPTTLLIVFIVDTILYSILIINWLNSWVYLIIVNNNEAEVRYFYSLTVAVSEELFFRGVILKFFIKGACDKFEDSLECNYGSNSINKLNKRILLHWFIITGLIIFQSILFTAFHINYYTQPGKLLGVFFWGLFIGILYHLYHNLSICILSHIGFNLWVGLQEYPLFVTYGRIYLLLLLILVVYLFVNLKFSKYLLFPKFHKILMGFILILSLVTDQIYIQFQ